MSDADFSLKKIAIPAFGPSVLFGIGNGAVLPVIALSARDLGASLALAGLIVALVGLGSLVCNIPAAIITSRFGERRSLIGASLLCVIAFLTCMLAPSTWALGVAVVLFGMATSIFHLARQTYLVEVVPLSMRARALSALGGTQRIGMFIGPFAGAGLMHFIGISGAYWVAAIALAAAGLLCFMIPDLKTATPDEMLISRKPRLGRIAREHSLVFLTLGVGSSFIGAMRAARQVAIPLWADHIGIDAATTSVIFGLVSAIDMLVFYPAGKIMDEYGRLWVALPCSLLMGISLLSIPLTATMPAFILVCLIMGVGNGIGSGIVMTLGADASPRAGRTEFLGIWRLIADVGTSGGPFLLSGLTAMFSLGAGIAASGLLGVAAAAVFWRWLPHKPPRS